MPTNRRRLPRARIGADGLSNDAYIYFKWSGTISTEWSKDKTEEEIISFWKANKAAIMARYLEEMRLKSDFSGRRPSFYFDELEEKRPRRKTGTEKWWGPQQSDGQSHEMTDDVYESDYRYLKRLGLLEKWELEKVTK